MDIRSEEEKLIDKFINDLESSNLSEVIMEAMKDARINGSSKVHIYTDKNNELKYEHESYWSRDWD